MRKALCSSLKSPGHVRNVVGPVGTGSTRTVFFKLLALHSADTVWQVAAAVNDAEAVNMLHLIVGMEVPLEVAKAPYQSK